MRQQRAECWVLHVCISTREKLSYCLYYLCALGCDFSFRSSVTNWCAWTSDTKKRIWTHIGMVFISHCTALVWAAFTDKSFTLTPGVSNRIILQGYSLCNLHMGTVTSYFGFQQAFCCAKYFPFWGDGRGKVAFLWFLTCATHLCHIIGSLNRFATCEDEILLWFSCSFTGFLSVSIISVNQKGPWCPAGFWQIGQVSWMEVVQSRAVLGSCVSS